MGIIRCAVPFCEQYCERSCFASRVKIPVYDGVLTLRHLSAGIEIFHFAAVGIQMHLEEVSFESFPFGKPFAVGIASETGDISSIRGG